ncbi:hypothetical protein SS50377_21056 [Spironucleus salmonicida]|uniref:Uncharacterized protein n=1 Tax=Spironucleus salmonicida TaxID=348837 RepID=V6LHF0_9EUKA|nr:hypothetical protein SS50377_21056 [Spironucleus salmonicida]|eukprot:EST43713.1 Hypothetical protein SS50377_16767 [Spironucleus salmonicida]
MSLFEIQCGSQFHDKYNYNLVQPHTYWQERKVVFMDQKDIHYTQVEKMIKCRCKRKILSQNRNEFILCCHSAVNDVKTHKGQFRIIFYKNIWDYKSIYSKDLNYFDQLMQQITVTSFTELTIVDIYVELDLSQFDSRLENQIFVHQHQISVLSDKVKELFEDLRLQFKSRNVTMFLENQEIFEDIGVTFQLLPIDNHIIPKNLQFKVKLFNEKNNIALQTLISNKFNIIFKNQGVYFQNLILNYYNENDIKSIISILWAELEKHTTVYAVELQHLQILNPVYNELVNDINFLKSSFFNTIYFSIKDPKAGVFLNNINLNGLVPKIHIQLVDIVDK